MYRRSALEIEYQLAKIAKRQLGLVTRAQAANAGIAGRSLEDRVDRKTLVRMHPGVYRSVIVVPTEQQRILAAWLAVSQHHVCISRRSAALLHGFPVGDTTKKPVELLSSRDRYQIAEVTFRRSIHVQRTQLWHGARVTTPAQTICNLAGVLPVERLVRCMDYGLVHRLATVSVMRAIVLSRPSAGFRGRATLISLLDDRSDGRMKHRSLQEQRVAGWLREAGLGGFTPNFLIAEAGDLEVDIAWAWSYVSLEISPFHTHGSEEKQRRDMERRRLLAPTRWTVIEVGDADIETRETFAPIIKLLQTLVHPNTKSREIGA
jgi:Transcriptional regulator, AbiEi antitoxin